MRECNRRVSFLIAAKSMRQKAIRFLASLVHPSKNKKKGSFF
jgi:glycerol-3-phosphate O-acyltransferase/dihydroxyacetone phosphate acyltransferase